MNWKRAALVVLLVLIGFNASVFAPVAMELGKDERNEGFAMWVYRSYALHPTDLTIDLVSAERAAPIDLYRGLFQASQALGERKFGTVTLARRGQAIFRLSGDDFAELGRAYEEGENPIYLVRTLPEKLMLPDGSPAYGTWTGGWLGVMGRQLDDVNDAAQTWSGY